MDDFLVHYGEGALRALLAGSGLVTRPAAAPKSDPPKVVLVVRKASEVTSKSVSWLRRPWIPFGMPCIFDGDPGLGKSLILCDLIARVTMGWAMPGETATHECRNVLIFAAEDSPEYALRSRLEAAGADLDRVTFGEGIRVGDDDLPVLLPGALGLVEEQAVATDAKLILFDPVMAYLDGAIDSHKDQSVRVAMTGLKNLSERTGASIPLIRHLNKLSASPALYRGTGSIAILAACRTAMVVGRHPDHEGEYVLTMNKTSVGPFAKSRTYKIVPDVLPNGIETAKVRWGGECDLRADDVLTKPGADDGVSLEVAVEWLKGKLAQGPVEVQTIEAQASLERISRTSLRHARALLKATSEPTGFGGRWSLRLPDQSPPSLAGTM